MKHPKSPPAGKEGDDETEPEKKPPRGPGFRTRSIRIDVVGGPDAGTSVSLPGPDARVGRAEECDLALSDRTVSRLHMIVRIEKDAIRVLDQGSTRGTWIDKTRVVDAYARPDSSIEIGETTLRLRMLEDLVELPISERASFGPLLGRSIAMRRVFSLLERIAPTDTPVLVEGETGTGKGLAARGIHAASARAGKPFVLLDCATLPPTLIEDELFGHVRGAFTSAATDRPGRFEEADGGTLFIDEIGELPVELQCKLLSVLAEGEVRRIGDEKARRVDVRVVAATNRCLPLEIERKRFRDDLYYRLAVLPVRLPPLRERPEDIPLLVREIERRRAPGGARPLSDAMIDELAACAWPGNVRELENAVERLCLLGAREPPSRPGDRPSWQPPPFEVDLSVGLFEARDRLLSAYERAHIDRALAETGRNVTRTAKRIGVERITLQRAMKRLGLRGGTDD